MASTQLSRTAFERLKEEHYDLSTRGRIEVAQKIEAARLLGDLSENGDYHAAKDEQGHMEGRIRQLEHLIENAEIIESGEEGIVKHADTSAAILRECGYDDEMTGRVQSLLRKRELKSDPETQTLEDVIDLVFLENYLAGFVASHGEYDEAKWIDILHKTALKMSAGGRAAALTRIELPDHLAPLVRRVLGVLDAGTVAPSGASAQIG